MKNKPTNLISDKNKVSKSRGGSGLNLFRGFTLMLAMTMMVMGCDSIVDQNTDVDSGIATSDMAGAFSVVQGSGIECIGPNAGEYNIETESKTIEWGNRRNPFEKTVEIEYYNTLDEFVLRVKSTQAIADVLVDDESIKNFKGRVAVGTWQEFTLELDADGIQSFSLKVAGSGPTAYFEVNYTHLGECVTACGDPVTFTYDGSEVTYGTVTGANGSCWLDRNLGATKVAESSTDAGAYGDYFTFDQAMNACPVGFRLAFEEEWEAELLSWISNNAAGAFASQLKLPMAGYFIDNKLLGLDTDGLYWSGTVSNTSARTLYFASSEAYMFSGGPLVGRSARCLKA